MHSVNYLHFHKFLKIIPGNSIFNLARGVLYFVTSAFLFLETCRQAAGGNKGPRYDVERKVKRESRAVPAPDANAELVLSMQVYFCVYSSFNICMSLSVKIDKHILHFIYIH